MILTHNKKTYKIKVCKSFISQLLGLMFKPKQNLLFINKKEKKVSLHMFFVFYPITILYLNKDYQVIKKRKALPFHPYISGIKSKYILELSKKNNIKEKETLRFN